MIFINEISFFKRLFCEKALTKYHHFEVVFETTYLNPHLPGSLDPLIPVKLVPPYHFVLTPILI